MKLFSHFSVVGTTIVLMLSVVSAVVLAHDHQSMTKPPQVHKSNIMIHMPWSRALPPVATNGAAYLMVHNNGATIDTIIEIKSPIATSVMMHNNVSDNGNVRMEHVGQLAVKPRGMVTFKPGGLHIMLMGLKGPLVAGQSFPITVVMEKAGEITAVVNIKQNNVEHHKVKHTDGEHHH